MRSGYYDLYTPGSVVRARSSWPHPNHSGVAGYILTDGTQEVVHSRPPFGVQATRLAEFALGRPVEVLWVPISVEQQELALYRTYSQIGRPFHLLAGNCEHFATWVVTRVPQSKQLSNYVLAFGAALVWTLASASGGSARRR